MNSRRYYPAGDSGVFFSYFEPNVVAQLMSWHWFQHTWPGPWQPGFSSFAWLDHLSLCFFCVPASTVITDEPKVFYLWSYLLITGTDRCFYGDDIPLPKGPSFRGRIATHHIDCQLS
jgi:hypothetical protein